MQVAINLQSVPSKDEQAIVNQIHAWGYQVDANNIDGIGNTLSDTVTADYSQLFGVADITNTKQDYLDKFEAFLAHFDQSSHFLSDYQVNLLHSQAFVKAKLVATFWQKHALWGLHGSYHFTLAKEGDTWKVTAITLFVEREFGTRDLLK